MRDIFTVCVHVCECFWFMHAVHVNIPSPGATELNDGEYWETPSSLRSEASVSIWRKDEIWDGWSQEGHLAIQNYGARHQPSKSTGQRPSGVFRGCICCPSFESWKISIAKIDKFILRSLIHCTERDGVGLTISKIPHTPVNQLM